MTAPAYVPRTSADHDGRTRILYAGPYRTADRAELSLEGSFAGGDVSLADRPDVVKRGEFWWVEVDG